MVRLLLCKQYFFEIRLLWPWPLTLFFNRHHTVIMIYYAAKYNEDNLFDDCDGIVYINDGHSAFLTLTFNLVPWPSMASSSDHSLSSCQVWRCVGQFSCYCVSKNFQHMALVTLSFDLWHWPYSTYKWWRSYMCIPHATVLRGDKTQSLWYWLTWRLQILSQIHFDICFIICRLLTLRLLYWPLLHIS